MDTSYRFLPLRASDWMCKMPGKYVIDICDFQLMFTQCTICLWLYNLLLVYIICLPLHSHILLRIMFFFFHVIYAEKCFIVNDCDFVCVFVICYFIIYISISNNKHTLSNQYDSLRLTFNINGVFFLFKK